MGTFYQIKYNGKYLQGKAKKHEWVDKSTTLLGKKTMISFIPFLLKFTPDLKEEDLEIIESTVSHQKHHKVSEFYKEKVVKESKPKLVEKEPELEAEKVEEKTAIKKAASTKKSSKK